MNTQFDLVLGTNNQKKRSELELLLGPYDVNLLTLEDFSNSIEVEETGETFADNAILKASEQARHLGKWVLGEDSGLSVDALGGAPGVYSARFSGPDANDERNNQLLLQRLEGVPLAKRTAHYTCSMALSNPDGEILAQAEDYCCGRILKSEHESGGFGYDPLFEIPEYDLTFGQLSGALKSIISHRARANRKFVNLLLPIIQQFG